MLWLKYFITLLLLSISLAFICSTNKQHAVLRVYEDGVVEVNITISPSLFMPIVNITLLGEPYYLTVTDENGTFLTYELRGRNLTVYSLGARTIFITYLTSSITSKYGEIWTLNASFPFNFTVILPSNAIILSINEIPISITSKDNTTLLTFQGGEDISISYTLPPPSPWEGEGGTNASNPPMRWELPLYLTPILLSALAILLIKRTRKRRLPMTLSEEERMIVDALRRRGGCAYQYEIARELNIPKTTLWRHVRRLSELGVLEVQKHGRQNYLRLK